MGNKHKAKGTSFETLIKDYLVIKGFRGARRTALAGSGDTGDINGIVQKITNRPLCIQCKNQKKWNVSGWLNDTVDQAARLGSALPSLVIKRPGKGANSVGESYVVMRLDDFVELLQDAQFQ